MFHHSSKLRYEVRVDMPDPVFTRYLQQAIGGIEGEIRVAMQYFFQAMGARGDAKYCDMLMTATEKSSHTDFFGASGGAEARARGRLNIGPRARRPGRVRRGREARTARPETGSGGAQSTFGRPGRATLEHFGVRVDRRIPKARPL